MNNGDSKDTPRLWPYLVAVIPIAIVLSIPLFMNRGVLFLDVVFFFSLAVLPILACSIVSSDRVLFLWHYHGLVDDLRTGTRIGKESDE